VSGGRAAGQEIEIAAIGSSVSRRIDTKAAGLVAG